MTELKPCPFCGSFPTVYTKDRNVLPNIFEPGVMVAQHVVVQCTKCFCKMDVRCEKIVDDSMSDKECRIIQKQMAKDAIERLWNRRA